VEKNAGIGRPVSVVTIKKRRRKKSEGLTDELNPKSPSIKEKG